MPVHTASAAMNTSSTPISTGTQRGIGGATSGVSSATGLRLRVLVDVGLALVRHERVALVVELVVLRLALPEQPERALLVLGADVDADVGHRAAVDRLEVELHVLDLRRNPLRFEEAAHQVRLVGRAGAGDLDPRPPLALHGLERQLVDELRLAVGALGRPGGVLVLTRWTVRHSFSYGASVTFPPTPVMWPTFRSEEHTSEL